MPQNIILASGNNHQKTYKMKFCIDSRLLCASKNGVWKPSLIIQKDLWGEDKYLPIHHASAPQWELAETSSLRAAFESETASCSPSKFSTYLNRHLLPDRIKIEGKEEIPCVEPYKISLPQDISAMDERIPKNASIYGMHGFCYDHILMRKWHNMGRLVEKARHFHCAFAPNFSVPMDGLRCEAIEAVRCNRVATIYLQQKGIPTIQTVSLTSAKFFDIAYAGLAPNSPVAFENICVKRDRQLTYLFRLAVEKLIELKTPTMLVVVGNHLDFEPQIPVVYYESRIQKLRRHGYSK